MSEKVTAVRVRPLREDDLGEADRIMRLAFGTFLGVPDPARFMGDADYVRTRWAADPTLAIAAEVDGVLAGSNFVTVWGSVGFFGPLTVSPSLWDRGVARALLEKTTDLFEERAVEHRGLFTFAHSPKHIHLYEGAGFLPRYLTAILAKPVSAGKSEWTTVSELADLDEACAEAASVTGSVLRGLDVRREIETVFRHDLGDTVLVFEGPELASFAVCHVGAGTEAGSGTCFVKFGAARPGTGAPERFARLLDACEAFAGARGATTISGGVNCGRRGAYRQMLEHGYRVGMLGVTMHQPDGEAYHHPGAYVIDDWR